MLHQLSRLTIYHRCMIFPHHSHCNCHNCSQIKTNRKRESSHSNNQSQPPVIGLNNLMILNTLKLKKKLRGPNNLKEPVQPIFPHPNLKLTRLGNMILQQILSKTYESQRQFK